MKMALGLKYKNEESILEEAGTVTPFLEFPLFKNRQTWIFYKTWRRK